MLVGCEAGSRDAGILTRRGRPPLESLLNGAAKFSPFLAAHAHLQSLAR
jgi:hypothetical protein